MAQTSIFDTKGVEAAIASELQKHIDSKVDEIIEKAKSDIEASIRGNTARMAMAIIARYYEVERIKDNIVITVKHVYGDKNDSD